MRTDGSILLTDSVHAKQEYLPRKENILGDK